MDADSSDGVNWTGTPFPGDNGQSYPEITYSDNYTAAVIPGTPPPFTPVPSNDQEHPTTYPIMVPVTTYTIVPVPVYGWKAVPFNVQPFNKKPAVRLVPMPGEPGY